MLGLVILVGCAPRTGGDIPEPSGVAVETTVTVVFYSTGRTLVEEPVVVDATEVHKATLERMLEAQPVENEDIAIVQTVAPVRSVVLDEETGTLTVDWDADVLLFEADETEERLAFASIMMTLGQFAEVKSVRFTVGGKEEGSIDGKDIKAFWGSVSLNGQPWDALRPPSSEEATETAG
jgi:hypothetical protein